ncbi:MAG: phosphoenolpyruvate synthase [Desulfobacteraceae bacterium]|nr:phosphoenolpyruvate synthase [Desulfobacteraceae bacterium]
MKKILTLNDRMSPQKTGGKFEKQQIMAEKGLPVPRFFCLTGAFYEQAYTQVKDKVQAELDTIVFSDGQSIRAVSSHISAIFKTVVFSAEQENEILAEFDSFFTKETLVSVRSSMIGYRIEESEDSADNPFAGISESFLYVKREGLLEAIRGCWASGFSQEAIVYRHAQQMALTGFAVAVGVQEMVFGQRSFVMFTCDPNTASKDTVIISGYGIGEGVVQERVPVDHYFKNYATGAITRQIAQKTTKLTFDSEKGSGLTEKDVARAYHSVACLSDDEIETLARYGEKIESFFNHPQDIEGAFTEDGKLYFLQSRPVALDYSRQRVWTNANVTESFPGVTTALTYSFSRFFYRQIFYDGYRQMGWARKLLHDHQAVLDRMIGFIRGRIYYSLTSFYHLHSLNPLFPLFRGYWEKMMGFPSSYQTKPEGILAKIRQRAVFAPEAAWAASIIIYRYFTHQKAMENFYTWWEKLFGPLRGKTYENEDMLKSVDLFHKLWRQVGNNWGITLTNDTFLPMAYGITEALFKKWKLDKDPALLSDLLCGDEKITSVDIILNSVRLAEKVNSDKTLKKVFLNNNARAIWDKIEKNELNKAFCDAVRRYLHLYGDRGLQELKMEQPNMRHAPWELIKMVQGYAKSAVTAASLQVKEKDVRRKAEQRLYKALRFRPVRRFILNRLLNRVRILIRNRENSRYNRSELFGFSKNIFRGIGEQLAAKKILSSPVDIMHLSMDDIFGYIDGTGVTENLQALANIRKKEHEDNKSVETSVQITTLGPVRDNTLTAVCLQDDAPGVLKGMGSSTGRVSGIARVILDPTSAPEDTENMILVARETDPGWLFLMLAAKGLVVERGSMLSHTAITGRKFGIPTIVSLPGATTKIPDGANIEIDGASGVVCLLDN